MGYKLSVITFVTRPLCQAIAWAYGSSRVRTDINYKILFGF